MKDRIKVALNEIHADSYLKRHTKQAVANYINSAEQRRKNRLRTLTLVPICSVIVGFVCFGLVSYNIEVSAISIDINPSVELGINRYDRVINVRGFNDDGERLLESVDLKNMSYENAIHAILECDESKKLLEQDENIVVVTIDTQSEQKSDEIMDTVTSCNQQCQNMYCYKSNLEDREEAVMNNISFGKYSAYLELQKYDPTITVDEIRDMPMREIREMIRSYETATDAQEENTDTSYEPNNTSCNSQTGNCNGNGNGENKHHGR